MNTLHTDVREYSSRANDDTFPNERPTTMREAAAFVAHKHGFTTELLLGRSRHHKLNAARKEFITICRYELNKSLTQISRLMGGRHHSTLVHYLQNEICIDTGQNTRDLAFMRSTLASVAMEHMLFEKDILGRDRSPRLSRARKAFASACMNAGIKFSKIGEFMDGRTRFTARRIALLWGND